MCMDAAYHLPKDIYEGLKKGRETEESSVGRIVLDQIIKNIDKQVIKINIIYRDE